MGRHRRKVLAFLSPGLLCRWVLGAGNETRTRDPNLGKVVLYQLSYSRYGKEGIVETDSLLSSDVNDAVA